MASGGYVTFRIGYSDGTYKDVNVPISDSNIGYDGLNTLQIDPLTFDDDGYRFTSETFRIGTYWIRNYDTTCTHDFNYIANSGRATWTAINQ